MDPLCHTLVGAAIGETRLGVRPRLGRAAAILGANLPDVDALTHLWGEDAALEHRRGWTHGVLGIALFPFVLTALLLAWDRWRRRRHPGREAARAGPLLLVGAVGVVSHPILDWLNTYGVRLLMPFDGTWFHADAVFIVDPWLWLLPAAGAVLARRAAGKGGLREAWRWIALAALTSFVVVGSGRAPAGAAIAWTAALVVVAAFVVAARPRVPHLALAGLGAAVVYVAFLFVMQAWARDRVEHSIVPEKSAPVDARMVGTLAMRPFEWDVVEGHGGSWRVGRVRLLGATEGVEWLEELPRLREPLRSRVLEAAWTAPQVEGFRGWARFPFAEIDVDDEGYTVWLLDARYVRERRVGFGSAVVRLDRELRVVEVR